MEVEVKTNRDKSEQVQYNAPDFPVYVRRGKLSWYANYRAISHWHDDIELIYVRSGHMEYSVNGATVAIREGDGIFVNSRQLHYGFSSSMEECDFLCVLLHPTLLCASPYIEQHYVAPVTEHPSLAFHALHAARERERDILACVGELYRRQGEPAFALRAQSLFFRIWESLFLLSDSVERRPAPRSPHLPALKDMIQFIHAHYTEKLTLAQISRAGGVGKTACCAIFQTYTDETPISYLTGYRLKKGMELLRTTDQTVSEICFAVGFSGASYFTETFRKAYGCTPTAYRRRLLEEETE